MLKARTLLLPALLAVAVCAPAQEDASRDSARAEKRIERFVGKMEKELKLDKDQSARIREILRRDPLPRDMHGRGRGFGPHGDLSAQLRAESVDTAALNRSFEERVAAMRARHAAFTGKFAEVHAVLTPEQREKAAAKLEKHLAKMEKKHRRKCKDHAH